MDIKSFISTVKTKLNIADEARQQYGKILAPNFNSFDFWEVDENKVSEILAFFLDPNQKHEQGDTFLRIFFDWLEIPYPYKNKKEVSARLNGSTDHGRMIDIVVSSRSDEFILGIENKIYLGTTDQPNQLKDYLYDVEKKSKGQFCLVYIAPKGKEPAEHSISKEHRESYINNGQLILISYEDLIIDCIHDFMIHSEADSVRSFLLEFEKMLKQKYMGEKFIDENELLAKFSLEEDENLEIAFKISNATILVKNQLRQILDDQLKELAVEFNMNYDGRHLDPSNWKQYRICFSYEMGGLLYGIQRRQHDPDKKRLPEIEKMLGKSWNVSPWWPMWQSLYKNIENNPELWLEIRNGEFKRKAREFIKLIVENFNNDNY